MITDVEDTNAGQAQAVVSRTVRVTITRESSFGFKSNVTIERQFDEDEGNDPQIVGEVLAECASASMPYMNWLQQCCDVFNQNVDDILRVEGFKG